MDPMTQEALHPAEPRAFFHRAEDVLSGLRRRIDESLHAVRRQDTALTLALVASRRTMHTHAGQELSYYEDRSAHGRPLVLIHGVNPCASALEMKPLFEHFRATRPVYAPDLPGFGFSARAARDYTPELYAAEITEFISRVKDKGEPVDVVALSLSCELVARVAHARKDLIHSLAFISPTGLDAKERGRGGSLASRVDLSRHWWSPALFRAIASKRSLRSFLGKSFVGHVDDELQAYAYEESHQPGAEHAPLAFLSGRLFTPDIYSTYAALERPVLALYDRDGHTGFQRLGELLNAAPSWKSRRIAPTLGMPHFERLDETAGALEEFWATTAHHSHHA